MIDWHAVLSFGAWAAPVTLGWLVGHLTGRTIERHKAARAGGVEAIVLAPDDAVILRMSYHSLTREEAAQIQARWRAAFGNRPRMVVMSDIEVSVLRNSDAHDAHEDEGECLRCRNGYEFEHRFEPISEGSIEVECSGSYPRVCANCRDGVNHPHLFEPVAELWR